MRLGAWLSLAFSRRRRESDLDAELTATEELLVSEALRGGMSAADARRHAALKMGGRAQVAEAVRQGWTGAALDSWITDTRHAIRALMRSRGFFTASSGTLALGLGVNVVVIAFGWAVYLRPLPYGEADRLYTVTEVFRDGTDMEIAARDVSEWTSRLSTATAVGVRTTDMTLRGQGNPRVVRVAYVTPGYFDVLRVSPQAGQLPTRRTDGAVLSAAFAGSIGLTSGPELPSLHVNVGGQDYDVVAVMPREFALPSADVEAWLPAPALDTAPGYYRLIARLNEGVTLAQFSGDATRVLQEIKGPATRNQPVVASVDEALRGSARPMLETVSLASLLVLVVAAANVAILGIGRVLVRGREYATQLALGAGRQRVLRRVIVEITCVAVTGATLALALAATGLPIAARLAHGVLPRVGDVALGWTSIGVIGAVTLALGLACGLAPGLYASRADGALTPYLTRFAPATRLRHTLLAGQVAASCALLYGALLLTMTLLRSCMRTRASTPPARLPPNWSSRTTR